MFVFIAALFKSANLITALGLGEQGMVQNGFSIVDPARNENVHVLGVRRNPDVTATVVCTKQGANPVSVVVHAFSSDESAARKSMEQIRDHVVRSTPVD
jgi:hypothetical protein